MKNMNADHTPTLAAAMRRVSQHWPLAYGKLLALRWEATDATSYGATDGRRLLLNPAGLAKLDRTSDPIGLTAFLLVHEALHALLNHSLRLRLLADAKTANIAADYVINALIKARNTEVNTAHGFVPFPFIEGILFDESISRDFSAEQVYQQLAKPAKQDDKPQPQPDQQSDDSDQQSDDSGNGDSDQQSDDSGDQQSDDSGNGDSDSDDQQSDDSGNGDSDSDSDQQSDDSGNGGNGGKQSDREILGDDFVGGGSDDLAEPEADAGESIDDIQREIEADNERQMLEDAVNARAGIGGGGNRTLDKLRRKDTGTDWAEYLRQFLTSSRRNGWDAPFNAPVYNSTGVVAAGRKQRALNSVAVVIDTSISVPQSLLMEMLGEVQHALDSGSVESVHLIACDWAVQQADEYYAGDVIPPTLKGGGGTMFRPAFDWIEANAPEVDGIVYLTDGEAYDWPDVRQPQAPVLWLDYGFATAKPYTFGEVVSFTHR